MSIFKLSHNFDLLLIFPPLQHVLGFENLAQWANHLPRHVKQQNKTGFENLAQWANHPPSLFCYFMRCIMNLQIHVKVLQAIHSMGLVNSDQ